MKQRIIGFDIETKGIYPFKDSYLVSMQYYENSKKNGIVALNHPELLEFERIDGIPTIYYNNYKYIKEFLNDPDTLLVGHNIGTFDIFFLRAQGITIKCKLFDTLIAHSLVDETSKNSLDFISNKYLQERKVDIGRVNVADLTLDSLTAYGLKDAILSRKLYEPLKKELKDNNLEIIFQFLSELLEECIIPMQLEGFDIDVNELEKLKTKTQKELIKLANKIFKSTGKKFNINSWQQLGYILYEVLHLPVLKENKSGGRSTDEEALILLRHDVNVTTASKKIIEDIRSYRKLYKLYSTYINKFGEYIGSDNKLHPYFYLGRGMDERQSTSIFGARTGRLSSRNPNGQNIADNKDFRKVFIPPPGWLLFHADYSQLELRFGGYVSQDEVMQAAFKQGLDIHTLTLANLFGKEYNEVDKLIKSGNAEWVRRRKVIKPINFGITYDATPYRIQRTILIEQDMMVPFWEVKDLMRKWEQQYWGFISWKNAMREIALQDMKVIAHTGRIRHFSLPEEPSNKEIAEVARQAINTSIQGPSSDVNNVANLLIHRRLRKYDVIPIFPIHDSIDGKYNPKKISHKALESELHNIMTKGVQEELTKRFGMDTSTLYLAVDVSVNMRNWADGT